jgi:hypothetical protein
MKHTYDSLKPLIENSQGVSIPDSIPMETLLKLVKIASKAKKQITIRVKNLGIEELKQIFPVANNNVSFFVEDK